MHDDLKPISHLEPDELRGLARRLEAREVFHRMFSERAKAGRCWFYAAELRSLADQREGAQRIVPGEVHREPCDAAA